MGAESNMTDPMTQALKVYPGIFLFQTVTYDINVFTRMQDDTNLRQQLHSPSPTPKKKYLPGKNVLIQI